MAHKIIQSSHPNLQIVELIGQLDYEDMVLTEPIKLDQGIPIYVLLDASKISTSLPDGFLDGAKKSFFVNENMAHMALYVESSMLKLIGTMVAKVTRRKDKLTVHNNRDEALHHLENLIAEAGL